ncbi:MAG TPA: hypothetical protein VM618_11130 [Acidimicrobiia bacterium]|nr:hypothetical protein [Acidimicrobiia bacterium]
MRRTALHRSSLEDERGTSLIEISVAMILISAVVVVLGPVMTSSLRSGRVVANESRAIDEMRIAIARIDRELRSACYVETPAKGASGSVLSFWTKAGTGGLYQVTYQVADGRLVRTTADGSETTGDGLVVTSNEFSHVENNTATRAQIGISLQVRFEDSNSPRLLATTVAGRNTWTSCS